jgi:hypothetical protein
VNKKNIRISIFILLVLATFFSCRKEDQITTDSSVKLSFSTDTIWFDTVFTQSGTVQPLSVTKRLWVYNPSTNAVKVNISLKGNSFGMYKLNIDGQPSNAVAGKVIRGKDSILIFIQMYVNQNDSTKPFIVYDEIDFSTNGNAQLVNVAGYSRNANYFRNQVLNCATSSMHWTNNLPYVIYDSILIPHGCTLTIDAGTHIYSHVKSCILVSGTLIVNGTVTNPVIFEGDRMEPEYSSVAGQWIGIRFLTDSRDNILNNAVIKNGYVGVEVDSFSNNLNPKLLIQQCVIENMTAYGLAGFTADLTAINNLITNCGNYSFIGALGGNYNLYHNTIATFSNTFNRTTRTFVLDNSPYTDITGSTIIAAFPLNFDLKNNIIYGSQPDEILLNTNATSGNVTGKGSIQNCLLKTLDYAGASSFGNSSFNNIFNQDPLFNDFTKNDMDIKTASPAKGKGMNVNISTDILGRTRNILTPTIGCYE